ncbi:MAG: chemotaxis protein CheA [Anaerolineaceae bacterium]|nr:chemotaxis protein CheA [Anaerolineaceae bacterium]
MDIQFDISEDELPIFLAEVDEHLQVLDENLVEIERNSGNTDLLQKLFRAAHTLKGMAGMIGHQRMTRLTHVMETAFDGLRKNTLQISTHFVDLCLDTVDSLRDLRSEVSSGKMSDIDVEHLTQEFNAYISSETAAAANETQMRSAAPENISFSAAQKPAESGGTNSSNGKQKLLFNARIEPNSIASAARAFQLIMALQEFGELSAITPPLEKIEAAIPVRDFSAELLTNSAEDKICKAVSLISEIENFSLICPAVEQALAASLAPVGQETAIAQEAKLVVPVVSSPPAGSASKNKTNHRSEMTVRTNVERLDNLMNLVGELITDRNHLYQIRSRLEVEASGLNHMDMLSETVAHLGRITDQLQEEVMQIRMLPISNVFSKFPRVVRDMAQKTGKLIDLVIQGEDTELDRSMIEEINDPLIHLVRNSVDHGIEPPSVRRAAGKPERGTITMTARHEQGRIILTIEDNGGGIDTAKVRRTAIQKGLISEEEANALSEEQAVELIFLPGLSTAQKVSDISGRGVGMDIVHTNIQRINGTVQVETVRGKGTILQITLPLTLAIVPTLLVRVSDSVYAIPIVMVTETLRLSTKDIHTIRGKPVTILRENVLPLLNMAETFCHRKSNTNRKFLYAVVVNSGKQRVGLVVDSLTGEEEVVVKSLGSLVGEIPGISSAAILGDGSIALIIDVPGLFKVAGIH